MYAILRFAFFFSTQQFVTMTILRRSTAFASKSRTIKSSIETSSQNNLSTQLLRKQTTTQSDFIHASIKITKYVFIVRSVEATSYWHKSAARTRKREKWKKWRTSERRVWNCDNEVFFYIKKKKFLTLIEDFYDASLWFHCRTSKEWLLTLRDRWIQWNDELEIFENFENRKISCVDYLDIIRSCVRSSIIDQIIHTWLFSRQFDCMRECRNEFGRVQLSYLREANNRVISQGWYKYIRALRLPNLKPLCLHANEAR